MLAALSIFGVFIWLFARRAMRERQQYSASAAYTSAPSRERLNQLHHLLPTRKASSPIPEEDEPEAAALPIAEEDIAPPSAPLSGLPWSSAPKPPQWLLDAGLFNGTAEKQPPAAPEEP